MMYQASRRTLAALAGAASLISGPALAQDTDPASFADNLRDRVHSGDTIPRYTLADRMAHYQVPGVAIAIIDDGDVVYAEGFGVRRAGGADPITADTVFSAGSVSKIATATLALRMAADGVLDLEAPVAGQLASWQMPPQDDYDVNAVSLRMILSHTAGFNLHGFGDFQPGDALPSVYDTLNGAAPAQHDALTLTFEPGTQYRYSGGGYTLAQLLIADRGGDRFETVAQDRLFGPLGMIRSSFANPLPESHGNIAYAHDRSGQPTALPRGYEAMPEMAASGLWVSARDLGALTAELIYSYQSAEGYLPQALAVDMMTVVAPSQHGLGPRVQSEGDQFIFHHGGTNNSYHAWIEGNPATGHGLVVLTNGANGRMLPMEIRNAVADTMNWPVNAPVHVPDLELSAAHLAGFAGRYRVDAGLPREHRQQMVGGFFAADLEVRPTETGLEINQAGREGGAALLPVSPTRFIVDGFAQRTGVAEIEFHRDSLGRTRSMTFHLANARSHYHRTAGE